MRISTKGDYGVRALIELSHHYGEGPLQSAEIAARQRIPELPHPERRVGNLHILALADPPRQTGSART